MHKEHKENITQILVGGKSAAADRNQRRGFDSAQPPGGRIGTTSHREWGSAGLCGLGGGFCVILFSRGWDYDYDYSVRSQILRKMEKFLSDCQ